MAVVTERNIGRKLNASTCERCYTIQGCTTDLDARTALLNSVSTGGNYNTVNGMIIDLANTEVEEIGENLYYGSVKYKALQQLPSSFHISFDISGQNSHITQSIASVNKYPSTARDFKGAMGVDADGNIQGTDILIPFMTFQINYTFNNSVITDAYIQTLTTIVGSVNSDVFHNFQAGTLLLTKVSGQQRDDLSWDLSFGFSASANKTGLTVGDITGIAKKGWEYMWVYYMDKTDTTSDGVTYVRKIPVSVHIEQVYNTSTYSSLGI
jgi:hypothetical protein